MNACSSATTRHGQLVLRMPDALLELPAVGVRLAAIEPLELGACLLELLRRAGIVDLPSLDGVVHQRERPVLLDLEEAGAGGELEDVFGGPVAVDPGRAGLQHRHQRRMARQDADLTGVTGHDQHFDLALECRPFGRHEGERERPPLGHYAGTASASASAVSSGASAASGSGSGSLSSPLPLPTASSIVPTM